MDNRKRITIQTIASLLQNVNLKGFLSGKIYTGATKQVCVPGLNCYSCPGAIGACPVGSLQNTLSSMKFKVPYYVMGILIFFGVLLGRAVCGFLCPFGFLQDLLYRIPFYRKIRNWKGDHILRYLKYVILIVFVIILPIAHKLTPFYCKYICPSGTLSGILLALGDNSLFNVFGKLFSWKLSILVLVVLLSIMIFRPFCKYICPLGAFYGLFNRVSVIAINLDKHKCVNCKACMQVCDMCVDPSTNPNSAECIRCGKCTGVCPTKALNLSYKQIKGDKNEYKGSSCDASGSAS